MKNITYILGAGASCLTLPLTNQIPDRLLTIINFLSSPQLQLPEYPFPNISPGTQYSHQKDLISDLDWLLKATERHSTVDTLAKKLFLKNKYEDLNRLKLSLSAFFTLEQIRNTTDIRYDSFFAAILNEGNSHIPDTIKILSWNYDYQLEKSYSEFTDTLDIHYNHRILNIYNKNGIENKKSKIFKLNGTAALMERRRNSPIFMHSTFSNSLNKEILSEVIQNYIIAKNNHDYYSALSFAWEDYDGERNKIIQETLNGISDTHILVIIGYSFPFFNRQVDRNILGALPNLKKVYFQSPIADQLIDRFRSYRPDLERSNYVPIFDTDQFYLPFELT